jgi:hypothetical protein
VGVAAELDRPGGRGGVDLGGEQHDRRVREAAHVRQPAEHLPAVDARQPQVEDDGVGLFRLDHLQCLLAARGLEHPVPVQLEAERDGEQEVDFVVHHQDGGRQCVGSVMVKLAPGPAVS